MLKKSITYTDFEGKERTEVCYFNISKAELLELDFSANGGMESMLRRIVDTNDTTEMFKIFKKLILMSYGEKSDDGRRFVKVKNGVKLADEFEQTAAYDELFMELATNEGAAAEFIKGIIPANLAAEIDARG